MATVINKKTKEVFSVPGKPRKNGSSRAISYEDRRVIEITFYSKEQATDKHNNRYTKISANDIAKL